MYQIIIITIMIMIFFVFARWFMHLFSIFHLVLKVYTASAKRPQHVYQKLT